MVVKTSHLACVLLVAAGTSPSWAFAPPHFGMRQSCSSLAQLAAISRKELDRCPLSVSAVSRRDCTWLVAAGALVLLPDGRQSFAATDKDTEKLVAGYLALEDLIDHWPKYAGTKEEVKGDSVRRQIGSVGSKSPLVGIRKVLLKKNVDLDLMEEFGNKLTSIDANAYASIFAASGKKRGFQFMEDAFADCKGLKVLYQQILESLDIEIPSK